jgi:hypothetical protein
MVRPSEVFKLYLEQTAQGRVGNEFSYGMLAMGLEVVTVIRTLEALPTISVGARQETISVLHTLLVDMRMDEQAYLWYERLDEWRRPKFRPEPESEQHELSHGGLSGAELGGAALRVARASLLASQLREEQATLDTDALSGTDRTTDPSSDESGQQGEEEVDANT